MSGDETRGPAVGPNAEPTTFGEFNQHEIYPMPMFATIAAGDAVDAVAGWYQSALGFATVFRAPAPAGKASPLVHLRRRKYQDLLVVPGGEPAASPGGLTLTFSVDGEMEAFAARARAADTYGASAVHDPVDTPWNTTDLRVTDPLGNRLVFTSRRAVADPEASARLQALFDAARRGGPAKG